MTSKAFFFVLQETIVEAIDMQTLRKEATARVVEFDVVAKVVALENEIMEIRFYYDDQHGVRERGAHQGRQRAIFYVRFFILRQTRKFLLRLESVCQAFFLCFRMVEDRDD